MADFMKAIGKILKSEGGYVNDKDDVGGETYKGISRKNNPNWIGWVYIDDIKKHHPTTFRRILDVTPQLQKAVYDVYKNRYWDVLRLDDFNNQNIANEIFDTCVNCGKKAALDMIKKVIINDVNCNEEDAILDYAARV